MIQKDEFISDIFKIKWGKFSGAECNQKSIRAALSDSHFDKIDFEVPSSNFEAISLLTEAGCILSSSKAFYRHHKRESQISSDRHDPSISFSSAESNDVEEIAQIAVESFVLDRYRNRQVLIKRR